MEAHTVPSRRVGLVSDTHIPGRARRLPKALLDGLAGVGLILHAGDVEDLAVLDELAEIAPVAAVHGNVDPPSTRRALPPRRVLHLYTGDEQDGGQPLRVGVTHGHLGRGPSTLERALSLFQPGEVDVVVFGHSHTPLVEWWGSVVLANPGSATDRRREPFPSFGILTLGAMPPAIEIRPLPRPVAGGTR